MFFQTIEVLEEMVEKGSENMNVRDKDEVITRMRSSVASKQFGQEEKLCSLIAEVNKSEVSTVSCNDIVKFQSIS